MMPECLPERRPAEVIRSFEAKVRRGCRRCGLDSIRGPLLAGFSGGADSTALLFSLKSLMSGGGRWPASLTALHVEHGLRPGSSKRDARHAKKLCLSRGIPFLHISVTVDEAQGRGLEDAARRARRGAFIRAAGEKGARAIALAHTQDDQAETVLMRLFEGAGPRGISGIRYRAPLEDLPAGEDPVGDDPGVVIVRPLLEVSREEVEAYLRALGEDWVEDESNADETRLRNLIRRQIVPVLRDNLGGGVLGRIAGSADRAAEAAEALSASVEDACGVFLSEEKGRVRVAPLPGLVLLPRAVRAGIWAAALERVKKSGGRRWALAQLIGSLDHLALESAPSAEVTLAGGMKAWRRYGAIYLGPGPKASPPPEDETPLAVPGRTRHEGLGIEIEAEMAAYREGGQGGEGTGSAQEGGGMTALLDPGLLPEGIVLRSRREGDRFEPAGAPGARKLKDYFIDRKVPRPERDFVPILASGGEVIWAVGHAVSGRYQVSTESGRADYGPRGLLILKARVSPKPSET